jgi:hypothetical protein
MTLESRLVERVARVEEDEHRLGFIDLFSRNEAYRILYHINVMQRDQTPRYRRWGSTYCRACSIPVLP